MSRSKVLERELFEAVYQWGKYGIRTDENAPTFQSFIAEIKLEEAKSVFADVWDTDGAPLQRDDPPKEILKRIAFLEELIKSYRFDPEHLPVCQLRQQDSDDSLGCTCDVLKNAVPKQSNPIKGEK